MTRVVIVDDSRVVRMMVRRILEADPGLQVVGEAGDGREAVALTLKLLPDLVVMDVMMPVMDGLAAVEEIMARRPTPILVLSANADPGDSLCAFKAIALGALDVMIKPTGGLEGEGSFALQLREKVKFLSGIRVMHHFRGRRRQAEPPPRGDGRRIVAIGASTGGPKAVQYLLRRIPLEARAQILIVQHIAAGFTEGFARWLDEESSYSVRVARSGDVLQDGVALVAPDGRQMEVRDGKVLLFPGPPVNSCRPSVDVLFHSLAEELAPRVVGVLLTGMGRDGAAGMLRLKEKGGFTIVQDEATSAIYGMPAAAIALGAAHQVLPLEGIPPALAALLQKKGKTL